MNTSAVKTSKEMLVTIKSTKESKEKVTKQSRVTVKNCIKMFDYMAF